MKCSTEPDRWSAQSTILAPTVTIRNWEVFKFTNKTNSSTWQTRTSEINLKILFYYCQIWHWNPKHMCFLGIIELAITTEAAKPGTKPLKKTSKTKNSFAGFLQGLNSYHTVSQTCRNMLESVKQHIRYSIQTGWRMLTKVFSAPLQSTELGTECNGRRTKFRARKPKTLCCTNPIEEQHIYMFSLKGNTVSSCNS